MHAVVARSTFASQNAQNTNIGPVLEVEMLKKCTKNKGYGAHLEVQMSFCVAGAGDCAPCQK